MKNRCMVEWQWKKFGAEPCWDLMKHFISAVLLAQITCAHSHVHASYHYSRRQKIIVEQLLCLSIFCNSLINLHTCRRQNCLFELIWHGTDMKHEVMFHVRQLDLPGIFSLYHCMITFLNMMSISTMLRLCDGKTKTP